MRGSAARARLTAMRGLAAGRWPTAVAILAIALVAWPYSTLTPGAVGDFDWIAGLAYAAEHRLRFGDMLVWTYGPLGFLGVGPYLYFGDVAIVTFAFQWIVQIALSGTLFLAVRRSFPALVAVVVAAVVTAIAPDRVLVLGFAWCVLALLRPDDAPRDRLTAAFPVAIGVLGGIQLLGKINQGVELVVIAAIALAVLPGRRRRDLGTFAAALLVTAGIGWFATGQTLADVWPYLRYGRELVSGYAAAMGYANGAVLWQYWAALAIVVLGSALLWAALRGAGMRRRIGLLAIWAVYVVLGFKAGFVRYDGGHTVLFFGDMLVLLAIVPVAPAKRGFALTSVAACALFFGASFFGNYRFEDVLNPVRHVRLAFEQARTLSSRDRRGAAKAELRAAVRAQVALPAPVLDAIRGRSVAFWPHSFGAAAYAYELDWRPPPIFEPYGAYTPALDALEARMLRGPRAPERLLRDLSPPIDERVAAFESPLATLAILCRYHELLRAGTWQVLAPGSDRCGAPRVLDTIDARWGARVPVPAPRQPASLLLVKVTGAQPRGLERVTAAALRPHRRTVLLAGQPAHTLVWETARDGLLLRAPAGADFVPPFNLAANVASIGVGRDGGEPAGMLRYEFVEVPIAGAAR